MSQETIIVLPSKYEGMPNIILESALFKIPFLISDNCKEIIRIFGKKNTMTFINDDVCSLRKALVQVTKSKKPRIR